jgi:NADPH-dependent F420 reductase
MANPIGVLGGTGDLGLGLAIRWAAAGHRVLIGSRVAERATTAADTVRRAVATADVAGFDNDAVIAQCDRLVLAVPFEGVEPLLAAAGPRLGGKLLIDVVVALDFGKGGCRLAALPAGAPSVTELIQERVPDARVVSAFKNVPASELQDPAAALAADVLLCGRDAAARADVAALVADIPGLRPVDVGGNASAHAIEAITALLVNVNRRHKVHASIALTGLPD